MKFRVHNAGQDDLDLLVAHRKSMWRDIHPEFGVEVDESEDMTRKWIREKLSSVKLIGFIAKADDGSVAGSGCIWIREEQPGPTNPRQVQPYLMSMFTEKEFRRKRVAKLIIKKALDWCKKHDYERIILHSSNEGRALYEAFGFEPTTEMRLKL